jgi:hypothetical protein
MRPESAEGDGVAAPALEAVDVAVDVGNPLERPYRTGSYLIFDEGGRDNFRSAWSPKLGEHRYRASGSHQLDVDEFARVLGDQVVEPHRPSSIYLVDLREETHGFLGGRAASWYADNDFANVGQPWSWIERDEAERLNALEGQTTQVFVLDKKAPDNRHQQRVAPLVYTEVRVGRAYTEASVAEMLTTRFQLPVNYSRIPVTDHCAPSEAALGKLLELWARVSDDAGTWVHFHCHGGDGRTTTFLALFDMLWWKQSNQPLPDLEVFASRQCELFDYCLNPNGSASVGCTEPAGTDWKLSLAQVRWGVLEDFRQRVSLGRS